MEGSYWTENIKSIDKDCAEIIYKNACDIVTITEHLMESRGIPEPMASKAVSAAIQAFTNGRFML